MYHGQKQPLKYSETMVRCWFTLGAKIHLNCFYTNKIQTYIFKNDYEMKNKKNPATRTFHLLIIGKGSLAKFGYKEKYEIKKKCLSIFHSFGYMLEPNTEIWQFCKIFLVL